MSKRTKKSLLVKLAEFEFPNKISSVCLPPVQDFKEILSNKLS
jgi:hypothetical protein